MTHQARRGRPPKGGELPTNRCIRLTTQEWKDFRELLGTKWLREQIAKAAVKQARKITDQGITP